MVLLGPCRAGGELPVTAIRAYVRRFFTQWVIDGEAYASNLDRMDGRR